MVARRGVVIITYPVVSINAEFLTLFKLQRKGNTFSLIPKFNILNKLFPEIKFIITIALHQFRKMSNVEVPGIEAQAHG